MRGEKTNGVFACQKRYLFIAQLTSYQTICKSNKPLFHWVRKKWNSSGEVKWEREKKNHCHSSIPLFWMFYTTPNITVTMEQCKWITIAAKITFIRFWWRNRTLTNIKILGVTNKPIVIRFTELACDICIDTHSKWHSIHLRSKMFWNVESTKCKYIYTHIV